MTNVIKYKHKYMSFTDYILAALLAIYPFYGIRYGVDYTDTGYSAYNFTVFADSDAYWSVATYLANAVGYLFTKLPWGEAYLGLKFYCTLILSAAIVFFYIYLRKYITRIPAFVGMVLAIALCWCPKVLLYNYLTYILFSMAALLLIEGLLKEKRALLITAGAAVALSVFVRTPNICECALILVVLYHALMSGSTFKEKRDIFLKKSGYVLLGFSLTFAIMLLLIGLHLGFDAYPKMLLYLFDLGNKDVGYGVSFLLRNIYDVYRYVCLPWYKAALIMAVPVIIYLIMAHFGKIKSKIITKCFYPLPALIAIITIVIFYKSELIGIDYKQYRAFEYLALGFCAYANLVLLIAFFNKNFTHSDRLLALSALIMVWITPLGSNNVLFPVYNNLFITAPVVLYFTVIKLKKSGILYSAINMLRAAMSVLIAALLIQSILFSLNFTFRDEGIGAKGSELIENAKAYNGMYTSAARKAEMEKTLAEVEKITAGFTDATVITFGDMPAMAYMLPHKNALSNAWTDLPSFPYKEFSQELENIKSPKEVIVIMAKEPDYNKPLLKDKLSALNLFLEKYGKKPVHQGENLIIFK